MSDLEAQFLQEIHRIAEGSKRVVFPDLCLAVGVIFPAITGIDQRRHLSALLDSLRSRGEITFPVGDGHFDRTAQPPLPRWIRLVSNAAPDCAPAFDPASFPWVPELRFAAELRNLAQLGILKQVNEFLSSGGGARDLVPIKERSVELFGDEKKLDMVRKGALFRADRLSLVLLRCYQVSPPLVWERGPTETPAPVLVVENHSTYDSFSRWNRKHSTWAAVCYGNGESFEASAPSLRKIVSEVKWDGTFLYFGDLDPKGVMIPVRASMALAEYEMPAIRPHVGCYRRLLERATAVDLPRVGTLTLSSECAQWLGAALATEVANWFTKELRLPQELVGYEQLAQHGINFARTQ